MPSLQVFNRAELRKSRYAAGKVSGGFLFMLQLLTKHQPQSSISPSPLINPQPPCVMPRITFVDPVQPSTQWLALKPRFVQAVESATVQLGPCAELLNLVTFSNHRSSKYSNSIIISMELAYMFDGRTESIVPIERFSVSENGKAFWRRISREIVGKTALAAHEIAHAHKRTGGSLHDLLASAACSNGAVSGQFHCPTCAHTMRLFGNIFVCHKCGATKNALC